MEKMDVDFFIDGFNAQEYVQALPYECSLYESVI